MSHTTDYMAINLRPIDQAPQTGWVRSTCPYCGTEVWDTDPGDEWRVKFAKWNPVKACYACIDAKAWEHRAKRSVQSKLWEEDAV